MPDSSWATLAQRLTAALHLEAPPIAITFINTPEEAGRLAVPHFDRPFAAPAADGRTGRVAAGCVFWMEATDRTFSTVAEDHANCSVGSLTHGFIDLSAAAGQGDVATLVESGWVSEEMFPAIPVVQQRPQQIVYGPLAATPTDPDVVFIRLNGAALMTLFDAVPGLTVQGKPQCHIIAMAKEQGQVAASLGCALSRVRTGMRATEMTCAIPAARLAEVVTALEAAVRANATVARYAGEDAARFAPRQ